MTLHLERLEERCVPAVGYLWVGGSNDNWQFTANWKLYNDVTDHVGDVMDKPPTLYDRVFFNYHSQRSCSLNHGDVGKAMVIKVDQSFSKELRVNGDLVVAGSLNDYSIFSKDVTLREYGRIQFGRGMSVLACNVVSDGNLSGEIYVGYDGRLASLISAPTEWDARVHVGGHFYDTYVNGSADKGAWDVNLASSLVVAKAGYVDVNNQGSMSVCTSGDLPKKLEVTSTFCGVSNYGNFTLSNVTDLKVDAIFRNFSAFRAEAGVTVAFQRNDPIHDATFVSIGGTMTLANGVVLDGMVFADEAVIKTSGDGFSIISIGGSVVLEDCSVNASIFGSMSAESWKMSGSTFRTKIDTGHAGVSFKLVSDTSIVCENCQIIVSGEGDDSALVSGNKWELLVAVTTVSHPPVTVNVAGTPFWSVYWTETVYGIVVEGEDEQLPPPDVLPVLPLPLLDPTLVAFITVTPTLPPLPILDPTLVTIFIPTFINQPC